MAKIQTGLGRGLGALISDANYIQQNKKTRSEQTESSPLVSIADIDIELLNKQRKKLNSFFQTDKKDFRM